MPQMHEIIAAEPTVAGAYSAKRDETSKAFTRPDLFMKQVTTKTFFDDESQKLNTTEVSDIESTVMGRLEDLLSGAFVKYLDHQLQKDLTNQIAKADLVVGGKVLAADVPATMLLQLEKELSTIRSLVAAVPTLPTGPVWEYDPTEKLYAAAMPVSFSTKKTIRPIILVQPTDKHPAQVEKVSEDVPVAKIERRVWNGMITAAKKSEMLDRISALSVATKKARQRANSTEVVRGKLGRAVADFILSGENVAEDE